MPAAAEEANESAEIPTKCVVTKFNLNMKAQIQYLDFEGDDNLLMHLFSLPKTKFSLHLPSLNIK